MAIEFCLRGAAIALTCASLGLGGCWYSQEPLIVSSSSANPVEPGKYYFYPEGDKEPKLVTLMAVPGGGYIYSDDDEVFALMVHEIQDDWYALQLTGEEGGALLAVGHVVTVEVEDEYTGFKVNQKRVDYYDPPCDEMLSALEGVTKDGGSCKFANLDSLVSAGKLLASRISAGEEIERTSWSELDEEILGEN